MATGASGANGMSSDAADPSFGPVTVSGPAFDIDAWVILQKGNLAVAEEVRALVADAFGEIARTQYRYIERAVRGGGPAAGVSAYWGLTLSTAEEVIGHAIDAQREIGGLLARYMRVNLAEITTLPR